MTVLLDDITLGGRSLQLQIGAAITQAEDELTIEGSPTIRLTVHDPGNRLVRSGLLDCDDDGRLDREVDIHVDGCWWRLAQVEKQGRARILTFEDRTVAMLRERRGPIKVRRGTVTHVEFAQRLVREVGARCIVGDPDQAVAEARRRTRAQIRREQERLDRERARGLAPGARLRVKGAWATEEQLQIAARLLRVADRMDAGPKATVALIAAGIVESTLRNLPYGDRDSVGVLQARPGTAAGVKTVEDAMNVELVARQFLLDEGGGGFTGRGGAIWLERRRPNLTAGQIAQIVQGSAFPARYDQHVDEARAIVRAWGAGRLPASTRSMSRTVVVEAQLSRGTAQNPDEDSWTALERIAEAYGYRCFAIKNDIYYMSDRRLMNSRPRAIINEQSPGVDRIDWEWAPRRRVQRTTIDCRIDQWMAPPGSVIELDQEAGPARGRWLVASIRGPRTSRQRVVEVIRGNELLRPRTPTATITLSGPAAGAGVERMVGGVGALAGVPRAVVLALAMAIDIHERGYPYVWGGGHTRAGVPSSGTGGRSIGFDCSGYTVACLAAGGMGFRLNQPPVPASGALLGWGRPGKGRWMTLWTNHQHVYLEFTIGGVYLRADTSPHGDGPSGPRVRRTRRSSAGFVARHWPGT